MYRLLGAVFLYDYSIFKYLTILAYVMSEKAPKILINAQ